MGARIGARPIQRIQSDHAYRRGHSRRRSRQQVPATDVVSRARGDVAHGLDDRLGKRVPHGSAQQLGPLRRRNGVEVAGARDAHHYRRVFLRPIDQGPRHAPGLSQRGKRERADPDGGQVDDPEASIGSKPFQAGGGARVHALARCLSHEGLESEHDADQHGTGCVVAIDAAQGHQLPNGESSVRRSQA